MAKKAKSAKTMDAHTRATLRRDIEEKTRTLILRGEGNVDQARKLLERIERLNQEFQELES
jgi:hypothetical protein